MDRRRGLPNEREQALAPGGALEAVWEAKQAGKVRHIGVTSHSLAMAIKLVKSGLFSTIQFPFNFIETDACAELFPAARELGVGILAMKPFAGGVIDNAGRMNFPSRHPLNQSFRRGTVIPQADVILALEVNDIWGTLNAFSDRIVRTSRPVTKKGAKIITLGTVESSQRISGSLQDSR